MSVCSSVYIIIVVIINTFYISQIAQDLFDGQDPSRIIPGIPELKDSSLSQQDIQQRQVSPFLCVLVCLSIHSSIHLFIYLSVHLSVYLSVCMYVYNIYIYSKRERQRQRMYSL